MRKTLLLSALFLVLAGIILVSTETGGQSAGTGVEKQGAGLEAAHTIRSPLSFSEMLQNINVLKKEVRENVEMSRFDEEVSPLNGTVSLEIKRDAGVGGSSVYVTIIVDLGARERIPITEWVLENTGNGARVEIPPAADLPSVGVVNATGEVHALPGDVLILSPEQSPIGVSFRENICTGYFQSHQDFTPALAQNCPRQNIEVSASRVSAQCLAYLEGVERCRTFNAEVSAPSASCLQTTARELNYNTCVERYGELDNSMELSSRIMQRDRGDFFQNRWRIFLHNEDIFDLAGNNALKLYDNEDRLVDVISL